MDETANQPGAAEEARESLLTRIIYRLWHMSNTCDMPCKDFMTHGINIPNPGIGESEREGGALRKWSGESKVSYWDVSFHTCRLDRLLQWGHVWSHVSIRLQRWQRNEHPIASWLDLCVQGNEGVMTSCTHWLAYRRDFLLTKTCTAFLSSSI